MMQLFQVPLRKLRRSAPMEKDMLLPRGEERRGWWMEKSY
jgi:hypothetical protein